MGSVRPAVHIRRGTKDSVILRAVASEAPENGGSGKVDRESFMRVNINNSSTVEQLFQEARMKGPCLIVALLLIPATGFAQSAPTDQVARCESLITTQQQAAANPAREFSLDLRGEEGVRLRYFGVRHTFDPDDPQYATMQSIWQELRPTEAFFEGTGTFVGDTITASLQRSGEPGLVRHLASLTAIPVHSLEPTRAAEVEFLLPTFTAEQLVLFFVSRAVAEERERPKLTAPALEPLLIQFLALAHATPELAGVLPDLQAFRAAYARWFPGMVPELAPARWFDPLHTSAETGSQFHNDIDRALSAFRDVYMYRLLARARRPGVRIFAEVGRDHIPAQAAALRCAFN